MGLKRCKGRQGEARDWEVEASHWGCEIGKLWCCKVNKLNVV